MSLKKTFENCWKSPDSNHTAPIWPADRKHCTLSTQLNPVEGDLAESMKRIASDRLARSVLCGSSPDFSRVFFFLFNIVSWR